MNYEDRVLALLELLKDRPISAAEIAKVTGILRPHVWRSIARLVSNGSIKKIVPQYPQKTNQYLINSALPDSTKEIVPKAGTKRRKMVLPPDSKHLLKDPALVVEVPVDVRPPVIINKILKEQPSSEKSGGESAAPFTCVPVAARIRGKPTSPGAELVEYFRIICIEVKDFEPAISWGRDAQIANKRLKQMSLEDAKACIDFYFESDKSDKVGITFSIAMSDHSVNSFRQERAGKRGGINAEKKRLERILGVPLGNDKKAGSVHKSEAPGRGSTVLDGEAVEVPEVETRKNR